MTFHQCAIRRKNCTLAMWDVVMTFCRHALKSQKNNEKKKNVSLRYRMLLWRFVKVQWNHKRTVKIKKCVLCDIGCCYDILSMCADITKEQWKEKKNISLRRRMLWWHSVILHVTKSFWMNTFDYTWKGKKKTKKKNKQINDRKAVVSPMIQLLIFKWNTSKFDL